MTTDDPLNANVAEGLRRWRDRRGLSQDRAAKVLGIDRTRIGQVENCRRNLTLKSVTRLANAMDVDPLDLLSGLP